MSGLGPPLATVTGLRQLASFAPRVRLPDARLERRAAPQYHMARWTRRLAGAGWRRFPSPLTAKWDWKTGPPTAFAGAAGRSKGKW